MTRITEESTQIELFPDNGILEGPPKGTPVTTSTSDFGSTKSSVKDVGDSKDDKNQKCQTVGGLKDDKNQKCQTVGGLKDDKNQKCQTVSSKGDQIITSNSVDDPKDDKTQKRQTVLDSKDDKIITSHSVNDPKDDKTQKCHTVVNIGRLTIPGIIPENGIESDTNEEVEPDETETEKENVNPTNGKSFMSEYFGSALGGGIDSGGDRRSSTPINGGLIEIKTGSTMMASGE